jgi:hypothetical protein
MKKGKSLRGKRIREIGECNNRHEEKTPTEIATALVDGDAVPVDIQGAMI